MLANTVTKQTALRAARSLSTSAAALASHQLPHTELFLHNSRIPTMHFQPSMPRLAIPKLNETLDKYLYSVSAIVSTETLEVTAAAVEAFRADAGPRAHAALKADDDKHPGTSYISEMWYDMYLRNRDPFPLNLTPQLTWKPHDSPAKNDQATRAADICHAAARYYASLKANNLQPDAFHMKPHLSKHPLVEFGISMLPSSLSYYGAYAAGAYPLDMSQYARLFCSTRVPRADKDELVTASHADYVAAFRGGHVYKIQIFRPGSADGTRLELLPPQAIEAQLRSVLAASPSGLDSSVPRIGALSGMERSSWAATRAHMETDPTNREALQKIDGALFVLSLDPDTPESHEELSRAMLHGAHHDRWFDKSFNIAVCANGRAGISWEHAWGDGVAVLNFFNEVHEATSAMPERAEASAADLPGAAEPEQLRFNLDSKTKATVAEAVAFTNKVTSECDLDVFRSETMTKEDVKRSKLSPDGLMQMVLQLAHVRAHGYTPSTYESATTAAFKHGRTETIRSATPEAVAMCKAFNTESASHQERFEAMQSATERHGKTSRECLMGKGVDRHLFALDKWCQRIGAGPQAIFNDAGWAAMKDIRLSTSTLASPALDGGGFGPVSRTSYGVGYGIESRGAQFHVTSYGQGNDEFIRAIESSMADVQATISAVRGPEPERN